MVSNISDADEKFKSLFAYLANQKEGKKFNVHLIRGQKYSLHVQLQVSHQCGIKRGVFLLIFETVLKAKLGSLNLKSTHLVAQTLNFLSQSSHFRFTSNSIEKTGYLFTIFLRQI